MNEEQTGQFTHPNGTITTKAQRDAIEQLRANWASIGEPQPIVGCGSPWLSNASTRVELARGVSSKPTDTAIPEKSLHDGRTRLLWGGRVIVRISLQCPSPVNLRAETGIFKHQRRVEEVNQTYRTCREPFAIAYYILRYGFSDKERRIAEELTHVLLGHRRYEDLTEDEKDSYRDRWQDSDDCCYLDSVKEGGVRAGQLLGIEFYGAPRKRILEYGWGYPNPELRYSDLDYNGGHVSFDGTYRYKRGSVKAIEQEYPMDTQLHIIARRLYAEQMRHNFALVSYLYGEAMGREGLLITTVRRSRNGEEREVSEETEEEMDDIWDDYSRWFHYQLAQEYQYQQSYRVIDEQIASQEDWYNEEGNRVS